MESGQLRFLLFDQGTGYISRYCSTPIEKNTWYHVVGTYDGTETAEGIKVYINGIRSDNTTSESAYIAMSNQSSSLTIGSMTGPDRFFKGIIS